MIKNNNHEVQNSTEYIMYNWLEALFAKFQMIVLWHEPLISAYAICSLLSSYFLLTYFAPRLYATILITIFVHQSTRLWFRYIWPEIRVPPSREAEEAEKADIGRYTILHPQLMTLDELIDEFVNIGKICDYYIEKMLLLRQEKPFIFCSIICTFFYITATIGETISGFTLIFCLLLSITIGPGIYINVIPESLKIRLTQSLKLLSPREINSDAQSQIECSKLLSSSAKKDYYYPLSFMRTYLNFSQPSLSELLILARRLPSSSSNGRGKIQNNSLPSEQGVKSTSETAIKSNESQQSTIGSRSKGASDDESPSTSLADLELKLESTDPDALNPSIGENDIDNEEDGFVIL